ncbi:MAG: hypothetical protein WEA10_01290 [Actinomycetota bacterium]
MSSADTPKTDTTDAAREALLRELYWAQDATPLGRLDTQRVRDALHDFSALMRADEQEVIPRGEPNLASVSRWRRQLKLRVFRFLRPVSWRYDRLLADHAELTTQLAERLQAAEAEVVQLRAEVERREADGAASARTDRDRGASR